MLIERQTVEEQAGVPRDEGRGRLEVPRLALDQGSPGVFELGRRGRAAAEQIVDFRAQVVERRRQAIGLEGGGDRERPGPAPEVEPAADAVGIALLLAEPVVQPRGELAAEDLVEDQKVGERRIAPRDADVAGPDNRLGGAGTIQQPEPRPGRNRRIGGRCERAGGPVQPSRSRSRRSSAASASMSPATIQRRGPGR